MLKNALKAAAILLAIVGAANILNSLALGSWISDLWASIDIEWKVYLAFVVPQLFCTWYSLLRHVILISVMSQLVSLWVLQLLRSFHWSELYRHSWS